MVDQSALTGETEAVPREAGEQVYSGSVARTGEAQCRVEHIGLATQFGKTVNLVSTSAPKLHVTISRICLL